jgi:hypothetical protein
MHEAADLRDEANVFELVVSESPACAATSHDEGDSRDYIHKVVETFHGATFSYVLFDL